MAEAIRVDIGAEFVGKAAFKAAENAAQRLTKQVSTLAKSYVGLQGIRILSRNSIEAAKAFAADDKAARTLTQSLSNLGLAFSDLQVKAFISDLEKTFGVLDDQLRPAFQRLLTTTGSVTEAQSLLKTALNLSAASGADVVTVAGDLSKGYVGQTRSLAKYGLGLSQAQLKAMTFLEVQTKINDLFGGQAQLAADSYSGSIAKLTVATNNAKEAIGKGLFDALSTLGGGGQGGFDNVIKQIDATSNAIASLIRGVAIAAKVLDTALDLRFTSIPKIFAKPAPKATITPAIAAELKKAAVEKAALKNRQTVLKVTKDQTKAIKEQTALMKAGTLFDTEQAGILAALKGNISKEERTRLELQLAILTGNTTEASKLAAELGKAQGLTKELIAYYSGLPDAKNPFSGWITTLLNAQALAASIAKGNFTTSSASVGATTSAAPSISAMMEPDYLQKLADASIAAGDSAATTGSILRYSAQAVAAQGGTPVINVAVTLDGQEITGAITKVQTNNYLSGKILALERLQSSFG